MLFLKFLSIIASLFAIYPILKFIRKDEVNIFDFIILFHTKECEESEYSVVEGAEKILKENNYSYFYTADSPSGDETLEKSKVDINKLNGGSIIIVKDGEVYASVNPDVDAIKNDKETKNWLSKYIDIN